MLKRQSHVIRRRKSCNNKKKAKNTKYIKEFREKYMNWVLPKTEWTFHEEASTRSSETAENSDPIGAVQKATSDMFGILQILRCNQQGFGL